jgi:hypothetical protein
LSISTKMMDHKPRDSTKTSVSTATDHSTSYQDSQWTELLKLSATTWNKRDIIKTESHKSGHSTVHPRWSWTTTGRTTALKSKAMVLTRMLE